MRLPTTTAFALGTLAVLSLAGCSNGTAASTDPTSSTPASARLEGRDAEAPIPLSSAALAKRLLDERDLGEGYTRKPERPERHDDVTVIGCPSLEELGGDAATGGSLDFPRKAMASFAYADGSDSEVSEELYSDTKDRLSKGVGRIFDAMSSCPTYQVVVGNTPIKITSQKMPTATQGDEQWWSQLMTFTSGGRSSVVKQTAIRTGTVLVFVSGSPALVDAHVDKALSKVRAAG